MFVQVELSTERFAAKLTLTFTFGLEVLVEFLVAIDVLQGMQWTRCRQLVGRIWQNFVDRRVQVLSHLATLLAIAVFLRDPGHIGSRHAGIHTVGINGHT